MLILLITLKKETAGSSIADAIPFQLCVLEALVMAAYCTRTPVIAAYHTRAPPTVYTRALVMLAAKHVHVTLYVHVCADMYRYICAKKK